jgi:hypothetical protein
MQLLRDQNSISIEFTIRLEFAPDCSPPLQFSKDRYTHGPDSVIKSRSIRPFLATCISRKPGTPSQSFHRLATSGLAMLIQQRAIPLIAGTMFIVITPGASPQLPHLYPVAARVNHHRSRKPSTWARANTLI